MLSVILKEETKPAHQALEAIVVKRIKSIRDKEQYIRLLHKFYGFHRPMEYRFDVFLNDNNLPKYSQRRRADLILNDLSNLGVTNAPVAMADIPVIDTTARAFGGFYVLEGSTMGGSIVAGMLIKYAGLSTDTTSFFDVYGENKNEMWQAFKQKMDAAFLTAELQQEVIAAANDTFTSLREWMLKD